VEERHLNQTYWNESLSGDATYDSHGWQTIASKTKQNNDPTNSITNQTINKFDLLSSTGKYTLSTGTENNV